MESNSEPEKQNEKLMVNFSESSSVEKVKQRKRAATKEETEARLSTPVETKPVSKAINPLTVFKVKPAERSQEIEKAGTRKQASKTRMKEVILSKKEKDIDPVQADPLQLVIPKNKDLVVTLLETRDTKKGYTVLLFSIYVFFAIHFFSVLLAPCKGERFGLESSKKIQSVQISTRNGKSNLFF